MRWLIEQFGDDKDSIRRQWVIAEKSGVVTRHSNVNAVSAYDYAELLRQDVVRRADKKRVESVTRSVQFSESHYLRGDILMDRNNGNMNVKRLNRPQVMQEWLGKGIVLEITTLDAKYTLEHDTLWTWVHDNLKALNTKSWTVDGWYNWRTRSVKMRDFLKPYENP